jgi:hypothetical protein
MFRFIALVATFTMTLTTMSTVVEAKAMIDLGRRRVLEERELGNLPPQKGKCCNQSNGVEWALIGESGDTGCYWKKLNHGECVGGFTLFGPDCEGMTCGGGFYAVGGMDTGACVTPGKDSPPYDKRRWTPSTPDCDDDEIDSPSDRGCEIDLPDYTWALSRRLFRGAVPLECESGSELESESIDSDPEEPPIPESRGWY